MEKGFDITGGHFEGDKQTTTDVPKYMGSNEIINNNYASILDNKLSSTNFTLENLIGDRELFMFLERNYTDSSIISDELVDKFKNKVREYISEKYNLNINKTFSLLLNEKAIKVEGNQFNPPNNGIVIEFDETGGIINNFKVTGKPTINSFPYIETGKLLDIYQLKSIFGFLGIDTTIDRGKINKIDFPSEYNILTDGIRGGNKMNFEDEGGYDGCIFEQVDLNINKIKLILIQNGGKQIEKTLDISF